MPSFLYGETQIYFDEKGSGNIPIIFIHPPAMGRKVFYYQHLLGENFHVIFPDLSGHGDSSSPMKDISIAGFAEEIKALMGHLGIKKAAICGYSSGGAVAQEFALTYKERTLALILSGGFPKVESAALRYEHLIGMYFVKHFPNLLLKVIATSHTNNSMLKKDIIRHMKKANREVWYQFYKQSLAYSCVDRLHKLQVPLLLLYGSRDFINQHSRTYQKHTNAQVVIIPKVSHQLPTKKWEIFNKTITNFLHKQIPPT